MRMESDTDDLSFNRRKFLLLLGAVGGGTIVGGYLLGRSRDLKELHISSGTEHIVSGNDTESYHLIRWEDRGMLTIEPQGSLNMMDINSA